MSTAARQKHAMMLRTMQVNMKAGSKQCRTRQSPWTTELYICVSSVRVLTTGAVLQSATVSGLVHYIYSAVNYAAKRALMPAHDCGTPIRACAACKTISRTVL